jgi:FkbM family methyltransferase
MSAKESSMGIPRLVAGGVRVLPVPWQKMRVANQIGKVVVRGREPKVVIGKTIAGFKMRLNLQDTFQRVIYFAGTYEPSATQLFTQIIRSGDTVIDGGANIGYFTLLAAKLVGNDGAVHSFEPIPETYSALQANVALNQFSSVHANCEALSDHSGTLEFEVPLDASTGRALGWAATQVLMGRGPTVSVAARTLDEYAASEGIDRIRLVKLDLEGGELAAVDGMQRLLGAGRVDYLITEVNSFLLDPLGVPHDALRTTLAGLGYRCFQIREASFGHPKLVDPTKQRHPDRDAEYLFVSKNADVPGKR